MRWESRQGRKEEGKEGGREGGKEGRAECVWIRNREEYLSQGGEVTENTS